MPPLNEIVKPVGWALGPTLNPDFTQNLEEYSILTFRGPVMAGSFLCSQAARKKAPAMPPLNELRFSGVLSSLK